MGLAITMESTAGMSESCTNWSVQSITLNRPTFWISNSPIPSVKMPQFTMIGNFCSLKSLRSWVRSMGEVMPNNARASYPDRWKADANEFTCFISAAKTIVESRRSCSNSSWSALITSLGNFWYLKTIKKHNIQTLTADLTIVFDYNIISSLLINSSRQTFQRKIIASP